MFPLTFSFLLESHGEKVISFRQDVEPELEFQYGSTHLSPAD